MSRETDALAAVAQIEQTYDCLALTAVATGAQARSVAHGSADLDLVVICVPEASQPVSEESLGREFDEFDSIGDGVDVHTWSLRGFYELLAETDPTAIQACNSPVVPYQLDAVSQPWEALCEVVTANANRYQLARHYHSMAENLYERYVANEDHLPVKRTHLVLDALYRSLYLEQVGELPPYNAYDLNAELGTLNHSLAQEGDRLYSELCYARSCGHGSAPVRESVAERHVPEDLHMLLTDAIARKFDPFDDDRHGPGIDAETVQALLEMLGRRTRAHHGR